MCDGADDAEDAEGDSMWFGASWEIDAVEVDALRRRATGMLPAKVLARPRLGFSVNSAWFDVDDIGVVDVAGDNTR